MSRRALVAVLLASFALRLALGWYRPNIHHADEVYQAAEQANRAVHGYGIVPWEFRTASRTAFLPTVLEPLYRIPASAAAHRFLQAAFFCALSLIPVWVAFAWGGRLFGGAGALLASAIMAIWFELVYFAPKATADAVCSYFLIAGLFLTRRDARTAAVAAGGLALALALALRIQIAPAIAVALAIAFWPGGRARRFALAGGVAAGLAVAALVEWRWWGVPFQGQIGYLAMEFTRHSSRYFAREPFTFFIKQYMLMYGAALPLIAWLVYRGARQAPVLLVVALAVVVPFHFVGHKEYRFVIAALPMLVLLMGLGTTDALTRLGPVTPARLGLVIGGWAVAMGAVGWGDTYRPYWTRHGNSILAFEDVGAQPDACGIALVGIRWWQTPGYSGLGREVPIYEMETATDPARIYAAANYVLEATKAPPPPAPYDRWREYTRPVQYLYRRDGACTPDPASQVVRPPGIPGAD
jgi:4-amino-4-deoxy-L-arabinose transferase-like glycosyltransferase